MSFYFDEDGMSHAVANALPRGGINVVRAVDVGMEGSADSAHLAFAAEAGLVLASRSRGDFQRLHTEWMAAGRKHAGIGIVSADYFSVSSQVHRITNLAAPVAAEEIWNQLEFISRWG